MNDRAHQRIFFILTIASALIPAIIVAFALTFFGETYESCMETCKQRYQLNIDDAWTSCDAGCEEKFEKEQRGDE